MPRRAVLALGLRTGCLLIILALGGCGNPEDLDWGYGPTSGTAQQPGVPRIPESPGASGNAPQALIYIGESTWLAEVDSIERSLRQLGIGYREITARGMSALTVAQWRSYQLLIVAGGYAPFISAEIPVEVRAQVQKEVREGVLNYLGFCAGAWLAVSPGGNEFTPDRYGFGLIDGPISRLGPPASSGSDYLLVDAILRGGGTRKLLWWGGPVTPEVPPISGWVHARYPDGSPAISQIQVGRNWVTVSGLHPTATASILGAIGINSPESIAPDVTAELIQLSVQEIAYQGANSLRRQDRY